MGWFLGSMLIFRGVDLYIRQFLEVSSLLSQDECSLVIFPAFSDLHRWIVEVSNSSFPRKDLTGLKLLHFPSWHFFRPLNWGSWISFRNNWRSNCYFFWTKISFYLISMIFFIMKPTRQKTCSSWNLPDKMKGFSILYFVFPGLVWASIGIPSAATALDLVSVKVPWHLLGVNHEASRDINLKGTPVDPRFVFGTWMFPKIVVLVPPKSSHFQ